MRTVKECAAAIKEIQERIENLPENDADLVAKVVELKTVIDRLEKHDTNDRRRLSTLENKVDLDVNALAQLREVVEGEEGAEMDPLIPERLEKLEKIVEEQGKGETILAALRNVGAIPRMK